MKKKWPAYIAVDRVTGKYLCAAVQLTKEESNVVNDRTARQKVMECMRAYGRPVLRKGFLTLSPPKRGRGKK